MNCLGTQARAMPPSRAIAVLFHENETPVSVQGYAVTRLADFWREVGHKVFYLFGTSKFIPADLVLVHVNLSVVPDDYIEFAYRYPVVLNGEVRDIRKSSFSRNIVRRGDPWDGKVIVKSDLNYGGAPEQILFASPARQRSFSHRLWSRYRRMRSFWFADARDYRIYGSLPRVPRRFFRMPNIIVEKFLPEMHGEMFCVRNYNFLGDAAYALRLESARPIVDDWTYENLEEVEPHPGIVTVRERLRVDYGKIDYVVVNGEAILFDVNKTPGRSAGESPGDHRQTNVYSPRFAGGIYSYWA